MFVCIYILIYLFFEYQYMCKYIINVLAHLTKCTPKYTYITGVTRNHADRPTAGVISKAGVSPFIWPFHSSLTFSVTYWQRCRSWLPSGRISGSTMGTMPCWQGGGTEQLASWQRTIALPRLVLCLYTSCQTWTKLCNSSRATSWHWQIRFVVWILWLQCRYVWHFSACLTIWQMLA